MACNSLLLISGVDDQTNTWCKELMTIIMQNTPHSWAGHTLQCFPSILNSFFTQHSTPKENRQLLKKSVEEEYRNWLSMSNESDVIAHFTVASTPPLFLCLIFKMILEKDTISSVAYKYVIKIFVWPCVIIQFFFFFFRVLDRIGARALSAHLRKLCDYLVYEVAHSGQNHHIKKRVDTINDLIWKYNIVTLDRLVLCLVNTLTFIQNYLYLSINSIIFLI